MKTTELQSLPVEERAILFLFVAAMLCGGCATPEPKTAVKPVVHYHDPLMSPGTQFAELPPAVQRTIRAETGGAQITDIEKGYNNDQTVYRVLFENTALFPPLYIASDGSVLNPDLTVAIAAPHEPAVIKTAGPVQIITLQEAPPAVVKAIQAQAPDAEVSRLLRETERDKVLYVVTFKDAKCPALLLSPDGTLLRTAAR